MFESLSEKLGNALRNLRGVGKLSEENMVEALKEVRLALLGADVHFKVAREFVDRVQQQWHWPRGAQGGHPRSANRQNHQ